MNKQKKILKNDNKNNTTKNVIKKCKYNLYQRMFYNLFKIIIFRFEYFIFVDFSIAIEFYERYYLWKMRLIINQLYQLSNISKT